MKIAVISDIHSNLDALTQVLRAIRSYHVDAIYCLGDIVGYGPEPSACVDLVRKECAGCVLGNHDEAVATGRKLEYLPTNGQEAAKHNGDHLSDDHREFLSNLPLSLSVENCTFVHATPHRPADWVRLESYRLAQQQFEHFDTDFCFVGHTHIPAVMADKLGVLNVRKGHRYLINTGSVGQPRDHSPRAGFVVFDIEAVTCEFVRVPYDVESTVAKIIAAGLPKKLAERLRKGV